MVMPNIPTKRYDPEAFANAIPDALVQVGNTLGSAIIRKNSPEYKKAQLEVEEIQDNKVSMERKKDLVAQKMWENKVANAKAMPSSPINKPGFDIEAERTRYIEEKREQLDAINNQVELNTLLSNWSTAEMFMGRARSKYGTEAKQFLDPSINELMNPKFMEAYLASMEDWKKDNTTQLAENAYQAFNQAAMHDPSIREKYGDDEVGITKWYNEKAGLVGPDEPSVDAPEYSERHRVEITNSKVWFDTLKNKYALSASEKAKIEEAKNLERVKQEAKSGKADQDRHNKLVDKLGDDLAGRATKADSEYQKLLTELPPEMPTIDKMWEPEERKAHAKKLGLVEENTLYLADLNLHRFRLYDSLTKDDLSRSVKESDESIAKNVELVAEALASGDKSKIVDAKTGKFKDNHILEIMTKYQKAWKPLGEMPTEASTETPAGVPAEGGVTDMDAMDTGQAKTFLAENKDNPNAQIKIDMKDGKGPQVMTIGDLKTQMAGRTGAKAQAPAQTPAQTPVPESTIPLRKATEGEKLDVNNMGVKELKASLEKFKDSPDEAEIQLDLGKGLEKITIGNLRNLINNKINASKAEEEFEWEPESSTINTSRTLYERSDEELKKILEDVPNKDKAITLNVGEGNKEYNAMELRKNIEIILDMRANPDKYPTIRTN